MAFISIKSVLFYAKINNLHLLIVFVALIFNSGCSTTAFPEERINIDKAFIDFFGLTTLSDTMVFHNGEGKERIFIISSVDSSKLNKKGWFINGGCYNRYTCHFNELGDDTLRTVRNNEISVSKAPESNQNGLYIQFGNLDFYDTILPIINADTIVLNTKYFSNYYLIKTRHFPISTGDIIELYINRQTGLVALKTSNGEVWLR